MSEETAEYLVPNASVKMADDMVEAFGLLLKDKFMRGQREHGGDLRDKPCIRFMLDEILDIATYHYALQQQIDDCVERLGQAMNFCQEKHTHEEIQAVRNILLHGNSKAIKFDE